MLWRARYSDGTVLNQYDESGKPNGYENIDRNKLVAFELYLSNEEVESDNEGILHEKDKIVFRLVLEPGQRLIYRRRVHIDPLTGNVKNEFWLVGWQQTINGINIQSVNHVFDSGSVLQMGRFEGGEPCLREEEVG